MKLKNSKATKITALALILILVIFLGPYRLPQLSASSSSTSFTNSTGAKLTTFKIGDELYITTLDADENKNITSKDTIDVIVTSSGGDSETFKLTETSNNSGIFRNLVALTTTQISNFTKNNKSVEIEENDTIKATYTDNNTPEKSVLSPTVVNEGGHFDDSDGSDDPSLYKESADIALCDPTIAGSWGPCSCWDKGRYSENLSYSTHDIDQWDPNDPAGGSYIPTDKASWDIYDRGQPFMQGKYESVLKADNPNILTNISADDGLFGVPPVKKFKSGFLPGSAEDTVQPGDENGDGYEYNSSIRDSISDIGRQRSGITGGYSCQGWNIHEFVFDLSGSIDKVSNIDLLWNGFHVASNENQVSTKPGFSYNHNDSYAMVLNHKTDQWEPINGAIGSMSETNTSVFKGYNNTNDSNFPPVNVEDYGSQEFKSSNPTDTTLADDITLSGSITNNFSDYVDSNGLLSFAVTEYDDVQITVVIKPLTLYTDFAAIEITASASDSSSDSLVALAPDIPEVVEPEVITPETCNISGKVFNDIDRDGIQDDNEPGLANVSLEIYDNGDKLGDVSTDSSGMFMIANLTCGRTYSLFEADPAGYLSSSPNEFRSFEIVAGAEASFNFADYQEDVVEPTVLPSTGAENDPYPFIIIIFGVPLLAAIYSLWSYKRK